MPIQRAAWAAAAGVCQSVALCSADAVREGRPGARSFAPSIFFIALLITVLLDITRVRADCNSDVQQIARSISVSFRSGSPARVGDATTFNWNTSATKLSDFPLYLVLVAPSETRFSGSGFLALNSGAKGLQKIDYAQESVRAFMPLYRNFDPKGGKFSVFPYRSGDQTYKWAVVSGGKCLGSAISENEKTLFVAPGAPSINIQDRFPVEEPLKRIHSPDKAHDIVVFKDRFEVCELSTQSKVLDRGGTDPTFSPTGRFVGARGFGIWDLVAGTNVYTGPIGDDLVAWVRNDSYAIIGGHSLADASIINTLQDGNSFDFGGWCHLCELFFDGQIVLDIDNGYAAALPAGKLEDLVSSQVFPKASQTDDASGGFKDDAITKFIRARYDPKSSFGLSVQSPPVKPNAHLPSWNVGEPVKLSYIDINYIDKQKQTAEKSFLIPQSVDSAALSTNVNPLDGRRQTARGFTVGGAVVVPDAFNEPQDLLATLAFDRLSALGVTTKPPVAIDVVYPYVDPPDQTVDPKALRVISKIRSKLSSNSKVVWSTDGRVCDEPPAPDDAVVVMEPALSQVWHWADGEEERWIVYTQCHEGNLEYPQGQFIFIREGSLEPVLDVSDQVDSDRPEFKQDNGGRLGGGAKVYRLSDSTLALVADNGVSILSSADGLRHTPVISLADTDLLTELRLTANNQHLVQLNDDGRAYIYQIADGKRVLVADYIDDEVVVASDAGRYDSTFDGAQSVQVSFPGISGLYYFSQFEAELHQHGLAPSVLSEDTQPASPSIIGPPPNANLTVGATAASGERTLSVRAASQVGLGAVRIYVDGRLAQTVPASSKEQTLTSNIPDPGSGHWISALAVDTTGLVSLPSAVRVPGAVLPRGTLRGVIVGFNKYQDKRLPHLNYASADARRFANALALSKGRGVRDVSIESFMDSNADAHEVDRITGALATAAAATMPEDTLVLFFSGHGIDGSAISQPDVGFALSTPITDLTNLKTTAITWSTLVPILAKARGKVVVVLDACHSGDAADNALATNEGLIGSIATASGPMVVLAAAKGRELSYENRQVGGGVFTIALSAAISKALKASVKGRQNLVDLSALYATVKQQVMKEEKGRQTPWLFHDAFVGEIPLF
jgi:hypothetical protein